MAAASACKWGPGCATSALNSAKPVPKRASGRERSQLPALCRRSHLGALGGQLLLQLCHPGLQARVRGHYFAAAASNSPGLHLSAAQLESMYSAMDEACRQAIAAFADMPRWRRHAAAAPSACTLGRSSVHQVGALFSASLVVAIYD